MEYTIAGIRLSLPAGMVSGHFAKALAPFAAPEKTEGPYPQGAAGAATPTPRRRAARTGADLPDAPTSPHAATTDISTPPLAAAPHTAPADIPTPPQTAAPDLQLRQDLCPGAGTAYRELDAFDFSDADADCRFGVDAAGYLLEMAPRDGSPAVRFRMTAGNPLVRTDFTQAHHPALLRFGLWTAYNFVSAPRGTVAFHSSVICCREHGILFLGESGTGKSTHTRLWREHIPGAGLLNDDSPILRVTDSGIRVFGSPWSGKTPCYRNEDYPVKALVRLSQAPSNSIRRLSPIEAIGALLPSCPPAFAHDEQLQDALCATVSQIVKQVPVFHLSCLPDAAAAQLAFETIFGTASGTAFRR